MARDEDPHPRHPGAGAGPAAPGRRPAAQPAFRAASSSASRWPGRSSSNPTSCCSTKPLSALDANLREEMRVRVEAHPAGAGRDHRLRHPRPVRGAGDVRPGRGDEPGLDRAARQAPQEVYDRPASEFVAGFLGHSNMLDGQVDRVASGIAEVTLEAGGRPLRPGRPVPRRRRRGSGACRGPGGEAPPCRRPCAGRGARRCWKAGSRRSTTRARRRDTSCAGATAPCRRSIRSTGHRSPRARPSRSPSARRTASCCRSKAPRP